MKTKPKIGDTLYSLNVGNAARNCEQKLTAVTVISSGPKYFVAGDPQYPRLATRYHQSDWREATNYSANSILFAEPKEWEELNEKNKLHDKIRSEHFASLLRPRLSLSALRKIADIIAEDQK